MKELDKRIKREHDQLTFWRAAYHNWRKVAAKRTTEGYDPGYILGYRDNALTNLATHAGALRALLKLRAAVTS